MAVLTVEAGQKYFCLEFDAPKSLKQLLEEASIQQPHPCGGRGTCGKCTVWLEGEVSQPTEVEEQAGTRLSCQAVILGDAKVILQQRENLSQIQTNAQADVQLGVPMKGNVGAAVDITVGDEVLTDEERRQKLIEGLRKKSEGVQKVEDLMNADMDAVVQIIRNWLTD